MGQNEVQGVFLKEAKVGGIMKGMVRGAVGRGGNPAAGGGV